SFELAAILLNIFLFQNWREDGSRGYRTDGPGCPSLRVGNEREWPRRDHLSGKTFVGPPPSERSPRLETDVGALPFLHLGGGPGGGRLDVRRIRPTGGQTPPAPCRELSRVTSHMARQ